ncbi:LysR family transcriptional regulator [Xanthomonas sp. 3075]|uniref:LysR family transcriptional regulator n=1 Tax=Xanthomonas sp. 3075 TaxID=3035315 RepID=UPI0018223F67|nr:LysR family transcriptional regulator [Xanthomonas sp. 3075]MBB4130644.1 DNA-binding transcriptional LysR family regulator [Xanthomonas sp. 3075]
MLDWEDLRHFSAFAQAGSLAAAARRLKMEHATVARRIAALEAALGLKLVDRRARVYVLTADGQRLAALSRQRQDDAQAVLRAAAAGQQQIGGPVSLSVPPATASALVAPHLGICAGGIRPSS